MPNHRAAFIGASGRIGALLRAASRVDPAEHVQITWQFRAPPPDPEIGFHWSDLTDPQPLINEAARRGGLEALLVFAGVSQTGRKDNPAEMKANVKIVDAAISAAQSAGISKLIVASSSAVYGAGVGHPFVETDALHPLNAYGAAKVEMEALCARRADALGLEICCLRIGNAAGADMLLGNAMARAAKEVPLRLDIFPDGDGPRRSYIGPLSLFRLLCGLIATDQPLPPVLNLGVRHPVAMNALLEAAGVPWTAVPVPVSGHQNITLNCAALFDICPQVTLADTAADIVAEWQRVRGAL
ncbi:NAD-dependent epimerase/dehydratase family protein [Celeribacter baekdonensis]|uniref:NAD-dependent epimerase/dehydratase family protein n=1 Tax=Celeribacter baekdonensis TaxID=875171 RepID=UPI003A91AC4C